MFRREKCRSVTLDNNGKRNIYLAILRVRVISNVSMHIRIRSILILNVSNLTPRIADILYTSIFQIYFP